MTWTGGDEVPGEALKRHITKALQANTIVTATSGKSKASVDIWIIWVEVSIDVEDAHDLDQDCITWSTRATFSGTQWKPDMGGGKKLGKTDHKAVPGVTYCYAIG